MLLLQRMKRVILILLICVYSASVLGLNLKQFYCCGKLKSVTVSFSPGHDSKQGCCKNKYQFFKVSDSHIAFGDLNTPAVYSILLNICNTFHESILFVPQKINAIDGSNGPPLCKVPFYISNCVFRI